MENKRFIRELRALEEALLVAKWSANDLIGHTGYFIRKLLDIERSCIRNIRVRVEEAGEEGKLPGIFWKSLNELTDLLITIYRHDYIRRGVLDNCLRSIHVFAEATETAVSTSRMAG